MNPMTFTTDKHPDLSIFIPSMRGGGAERVAVTLANGLADQLQSVDLLVATGEKSDYGQLVTDKVNVRYFRCNRTAQAIQPLRQYFKNANPEVFLSIMDHAAVTAYIAKKLSRVTTTRMYAREAIAIEYKAASESNIKKSIFHYLVSRSYRSMQGVISPSVDLSNSLQHFYNLQNVTTIANPVVGTEFVKKSNLPPAVPVPWGAEHFVIVAAGRFVEQKDFATLLNGFAKARQQIPCKLILLGEGPLRRSLEAKIETLKITSDCWLPGFVENPLPYFKLGNVFALTSLQEGLPNALIQALACGTNAIATDCPTGPREILQTLDLGTLIGVGDSDALADGIVGNYPSAALSPGQIQHIHDTFGETRILDQYMKLLFPG